MRTFSLNQRASGRPVSWRQDGFLIQLPSMPQFSHALADHSRRVRRREIVPSLHIMTGPSCFRAIRVLLCVVATSFTFSCARQNSSISRGAHESLASDQALTLKAARQSHTADSAPDAKTCCACVYQDNPQKPCKKQSKEECLNGDHSPCFWQGGKCISKWSKDCEGPDSPFARYLRDRGYQCNVTDAFPNTSFIENPSPDQPSLERWSAANSCTNLHVWYSGHGRGYATEGLAGEICATCPGGNSSLTCTGCNGMCRKDLEAVKSAMCAKLKETGKSGSISTSGNQTEVCVHEKMSQMTLTVRYTPPPQESCSMEISFGSCENGISQCNEDDVNNGAYYLCHNGKGIVKMQCTCSPPRNNNRPLNCTYRLRGT